MLCDSHIHYIPESIGQYTAFYKGVWNDKLKLYDFLDKNHIEKALLTYPSTDAQTQIGYARLCQQYNQEVFAISKENKKIIPAGIVDFQEINSLPQQVKDLAYLGFKSISIATSFEGRFIVEQLDHFFQACQDHNLAVFVHPQTINPIGFDRVKDPLLMPVLEYSLENSMFLGLLMMAGVLQKYKINFIFASLSGVTPGLKNRFDRVYQMLRARGMVKDLGKLPSEILGNVYVETSGSSLNNLKDAIELFGVDRILWGSDYPVTGEVKENIAMFDQFGQTVKNKVMSENFLRIFA